MPLTVNQETLARLSLGSSPSWSAIYVFHYKGEYKMKNKLTFEEHQTLAKDLFAMRKELFKVLKKVTSTHNVTAPIIKKILKTQRYLDEVRSSLDSELCSSFPDKFNVKVYYPGRHE